MTEMKPSVTKKSDDPGDTNLADATKTQKEKKQTTFSQTIYQATTSAADSMYNATSALTQSAVSTVTTTAKTTTQAVSNAAADIFGRVSEVAGTVMDYWTQEKKEQGTLNQETMTLVRHPSVVVDTAYCPSPSLTLDRAFDKKGIPGFRRESWRFDNKCLEVPDDQVEQCLELMQKKIEQGCVPGMTDPFDAHKLIVSGNVTYLQSRNIARTGKVASLWLDSRNRVGTSDGMTPGFISRIAACTWSESIKDNPLNWSLDRFSDLVLNKIDWTRIYHILEDGQIKDGATLSEAVISGAASGAAIGLICPLVGTLAGAAVGGLGAFANAGAHSLKRKLWPVQQATYMLSHDWLLCEEEITELGQRIIGKITWPWLKKLESRYITIEQRIQAVYEEFDVACYFAARKRKEVVIAPKSAVWYDPSHKQGATQKLPRTPSPR
ncbi:MAG: hypothetical protein Q4G68_12875 [Planctomycetia bacterium]|nr:hypothetical protein [Planctomycetia bacterium]